MTPPELPVRAWQGLTIRHNLVHPDFSFCRLNYYPAVDLPAIIPCHRGGHAIYRVAQDWATIFWPATPLPRRVPHGPMADPTIVSAPGADADEQEQHDA